MQVLSKFVTHFFNMFETKIDPVTPFSLKVSNNRSNEIRVRTAEFLVDFNIPPQLGEEYWDLWSQNNVFCYRFPVRKNVLYLAFFRNNQISFSLKINKKLPFHFHWSRIVTFLTKVNCKHYVEAIEMIYFLCQNF